MAIVEREGLLEGLDDHARKARLGLIGGFSEPLARVVGAAAPVFLGGLGLFDAGEG